MAFTGKKLAVDGKGRITLGKLIDESVTSVVVNVQEDGSMLLEPQIEIPAREAWLYKNKEALASVRRGLEQSAQGKTRPAKEDFTKYIDKDE